MKNKKKLLALTLAAALVIVAVGCARNTAPTSEAAPETLSVKEMSATGNVKPTATTTAFKEFAPDIIPLAAAPNVTAIAFNKSTDLTLNTGVTNRRYATTTPAGGAVNYTSSDAAVATVSANGTVTTLAPGKTVISATSGDKAARYNLTVVGKAATPPTATAATTPAGEKSGALAGYAIVVNDATTTAVKASSPGLTFEKYYFYSADGKELGYMLGKDVDPIQRKYMVGIYAPANDGDWSAWFADQFNLYRGLAVTGGTTNGNGSGIENSEAVVPGIVGSAQSVDIEAYRQEVLRLTNKERAKAGLDELVWDDDVAEYAQIRAEELLISASHTRPDNQEKGVGSYEVFENIAGGQRTPSAVVEAWMNSKGHRAAILGDHSAGDNLFGAGCYQAPNGRLYWTQVFVLWDADA